MSENDALAFIALVLSIAFTVPTTVWIWTRRAHRGEIKPANSASDERLARIEQAIDAMALEIERISEGQRFTTKLLADRHTEGLPSVPPSDRRP